MTRDHNRKPRLTARERRMTRAAELAVLAGRSNNPAARAAYLQLAAAFQQLAKRPERALTEDEEEL